MIFLMMGSNRQGTRNTFSWGNEIIGQEAATQLINQRTEITTITMKNGYMTCRIVKEINLLLNCIPESNEYFSDQYNEQDLQV